MSGQLRKEFVTRHEKNGFDGWILAWDSTVPFEPGQVVPVTVSPDLPPRLYSLVSGVNDSDRSLLYTVVSGGELTPRLAELKPGDPLFVGEPTGSFRTPKGPAVWISNGTGIAPYLSMLRSGLSQDKLLIHGARFQQQFYDQEFLSSVLAKNYVRCASADLGEGLFPGRLTTYVSQQTWNPEVPCLLCGSASMIVETRDLLIQAGVPFSKILSEVYF